MWLFPSLGNSLEIFPVAFCCEFSINLHVVAADGENLRWLISYFSKSVEFISQVLLEENRLENV